MKPDEYDLVRLVRSVPGRDIPIGAEGTIVMVLSAKGSPNGYLVEFPDFPQPDITATLVQGDFEVVTRSASTDD